MRRHTKSAMCHTVPSRVNCPSPQTSHMDTPTARLARPAAQGSQAAAPAVLKLPMPQRRHHSCEGEEKHVTNVPFADPVSHCEKETGRDHLAMPPRSCVVAPRWLLAVPAGQPSQAVARETFTQRPRASAAWTKAEFLECVQK